jgi:hypothetical protein
MDRTSLSSAVKTERSSALSAAIALVWNVWPLRPSKVDPRIVQLRSSHKMQIGSSVFVSWRSFNYD